MADAAAGVEKVVVVKKQSASGAPASNTGGQELRRTSFTMNLEKDAYQSPEMTSSGMDSEHRHGVRRAPGSLTNVLSPGTFALFMAAVCRKDFAAGATTGAVTTIAAVAQTGGNPAKFTRSSGSFLTDGFKVGDVIRPGGFAAPATANNGKNLRVTRVVALEMDVGTAASSATGQPEALVAKAAGDTVTLAVAGKKTYYPRTGRTKDLFTIEEWFADVLQSEMFYDVRVISMNVKIPATGYAEVTFTMTGKDIVTGTAQYFSSPTAVTTTGLTAGAQGLLNINGADAAVVTSLDFTITLDADGPPVVGSNTIPQIFFGKATLEGTFTALFTDGTLRDAFLNETEGTLSAMLTTSPATTAAFIVFKMPRVKFNGAAKGDDPKAIIRTYPFKSLENLVGGTGTSTERTLLEIQDSEVT